DIYKLNPDAQRGIKESDVLVIPAAGKAASADKPAIKSASHTAKPKETLYSISKQYGVTVSDLKAANPELEHGLKIGQTIRIPGNSPQVSGTPVASPTKSTAVTTVKTSVNGNIAYHVVAPKETKFGIAKKYGMTVAELE